MEEHHHDFRKVESTNDPARKSWLDTDSNPDFPIQNLPFGIFSSADSGPRAGVAIGDKVLDLAVLADHGHFNTLGLESGEIFKAGSLNGIFERGKPFLRDLRYLTSELLEEGNPVLRDDPDLLDKVLHPADRVQMHLPVEVGDYTDFYSSLQHARNVGRLFRDPENALLPNWKHLPVGYHGRASSIICSDVEVRRPKGQFRVTNREAPEFGPTRKLDFELEVAFITCGENELGQSIPIQKAEEHIMGFVLCNDWSARDIQAWEYVPLGPFLGKSFATSISPWVVLMDALEPFRVEGPEQDPEVVPYLRHTQPSNFDINLEVAIKAGSAGPYTVTRTNYRNLYWSPSQQLAHQTVNGCNIRTGDLYASGTISGNEEGSLGSLLEIARDGRQPLTLDEGIHRAYLEDGDEVVMRGWSTNNGIRIGFGELKNRIIPADT